MNKPIRTMTALAVDTGKVLALLAKIYPTLSAAIREALQNAIDARATRIEIELSLAPPKKGVDTRYIAVYDNGIGMSAPEFAERMVKICASGKSGDASQMGRFGIGLLAFYGKAKTYVLTSAAKAAKGTTAWLGYTSHQLSSVQVDDQGCRIPSEPVHFEQIPWWNTRVLVRQFDQRPQVNFTGLVGAIESNFGVALTAQGTTVTVKYTDGSGTKTSVIGPRAYKGERWKRFHRSTPSCGLVQFDLYDEPTGDGRVSVMTGANLFSVNLRTLRETLIQHGVAPKRLDQLVSGRFAGEIRLPQAAWNPSRTGLDNTDMELEFALCFIEFLEAAWVQEKLTQNERKDQDLLETKCLKGVIDFLDELFNRDPEALYDALVTIETASVSKGHVPVGNGPKVKGRSSPDRQPNPRPNGPSRPSPKPPEKEREGKGHFVAVLPGGEPRTQIKGQLGLSVSIEPIPASLAPVEIRPNAGLVVVNARHPFYQSIRTDEMLLSQYLRGVVELALMIMRASPVTPSDQSDELIALMTEQYMAFLTYRIKSTPTTSAGCKTKSRS